VQALATQNDGGDDPTVSAIKAAQRQPKALVPGALRGDRRVNPNSDDSFAA
jgi:hypothetical protein